MLQAQVNAGGKERSAFQEYNKDFPHKQYTMGYAGYSGSLFVVCFVFALAKCCLTSAYKCVRVPCSAHVSACIPLMPV